MANENKPETIDQKRKTLKLLGTAWVTPTVLSATIPAHAQTTGALCGGMDGVAGVWYFTYYDALDDLALYPNGVVIRLQSDASAKWSLEGSTVTIWGFERRPSLIITGELDSSCTTMTGNINEGDDPFEAEKSNQPLP